MGAVIIPVFQWGEYMKTGWVVFILLVLGCAMLSGSGLEVFLSGRKLPNDRFFQVDNTVFIHAVSLAEALGAEYEWNNTHKTLTMYFEGREILFYNQSVYAWMDNRFFEMRTYPRLFQNRFFIPLECFSLLTGLSYVMTGSRIDLAQIPSDLASHHNPLEADLPPSTVPITDQVFLDLWEIGMRKKPLILIDPGHGGRDPGAIGPGGSTEASIALSISLKLRQLLIQNGFDVIMTRTEDVFVSLQQRAILANEKKADLFVSIHLNAFSNPQVRGAEVYFYDYTEQRYRGRLQRLHGEELPTSLDTLKRMVDHKETTQQYSEIAAKQILKAFDDANYPQRGVRRGDFAVLAFTTVPSVLIECDFLSNPQVENQLRLTSGQQKMAGIIFRGIQGYFHFLDR